MHASHDDPRTDSRNHVVERALETMDPAIRVSFTEEQYGAVRRAMLRCVRQRGRFPVDLRFTVNLLLGRYFVVFLAGPERRSPERTAAERRARRLTLANAVVIATASVLLLLAILGAAYAVKSVVGIDLVPSVHLGDLFG